MAEPIPKGSKVGIIGSGLIGQNWSMILAGAGFQPCLFDVDEAQLSRAKDNTRASLDKFETSGSLRGSGTAAEQADRISFTTSLADCVKDAAYIQECVPEDLKLKTKVFGQLDELVSDDQIVASSSSCLCASMFAGQLKHKENMLVAHPINPPYFVPLVEIVPAPFTRPEVTQKVRQLMQDVGQAPITLRKESLGFALNRIQYACINECWNMYQTGLLSAEDIDTVVHQGLGLRYAFIGPLETMHLNANGIKDYCERYAEGAYNVQKETFKPLPVMYDTETAAKIEEEMKASLPLEKLAERRQWRDSMLGGLAKLKSDMKKESN